MTRPTQIRNELFRFQANWVDLVGLTMAMVMTGAGTFIFIWWLRFWLRCLIWIGFLVWGAR